MILQYGACFGTELAMNAQLATHFRVYFQMEAGAASVLAGCFGLMNLFARSLGGIFSDFLFARYGFPGRIGLSSSTSSPKASFSLASAPWRTPGRGMSL